MAKRSTWASLSDTYKRRLERNGITEQGYASGAPIKAARGHAVTPERPKQAFRNPDQYSDYLRRRVTKGKHVPEGTLPPPRNGGKSRTGDEDSDRPDIGGSIGWAGRETLDVITFYRSAGGIDRGDQGVMQVTSFRPDGTIANVRRFTYNQADFYALIDLAKQRGYAVTVESIGPQAMSVIA